MPKLSDVLFDVHIIIFLVWFGLFLIPASLWPGRLAFHFWYVGIMVVSQIITGLILMKKMKKFRIVCPLTSLMQYSRGYTFSDKKNYDHSFVREFLHRYGLRIPRGTIGVLIFLSLALLIWQYVIY